MSINKTNMRKVTETWLSSWMESNRRVTFPNQVSDALRLINTSARELQDILSQLLIKQKRTPLEEELFNLYLNLRFECENSIADNVSNQTNGGIFLLKSQYGYEDKQTVKVETESLSDIINNNSPHSES